jgi:hypothetical protein
MVSLTASGEIFTLTTAGEATSPGGWVTADGRVGVGADVMADLTLCHGIDATLGARIAAEAAGDAGSLLRIGAGIDLSATAQAYLRGRFSGNVFDDFGITLGVGSQLSARVASQLSISVDTSAIARAAYAELGADSLAAKMFVAFLNEVHLEAGVMASASVGSSAQHISHLTGNLLEHPARIELSTASDAVALVGPGYETYTIAEIADPRRMSLTMTEIAAGELGDLAREELPENLHFLVEWFELLAPATTAIVWEVAEQTTRAAHADFEGAATAVVDAVLGRLQTLLLDKAVDVGFELANQVMTDLGLRLRLQNDATTRTQLANGVQALADALPAGNMNVFELGEAAGDLLDIIDAAAEAVVARQVRRPLAVMWTAAACGVALRDPAVAGGISATTETRVVGATRVTGESFLAVPSPPLWVRAEWAGALQRTVPDPVGFADAVDALVAMGVGQLLTEPEPLQPMLRDLGVALDLSVGDLVETAIGLVADQPLTGTPVYRALRDLLARQVDELMMGQLVPAIRAALPPGDESMLWLDEAAVPSLLGVRHFVFARVDALVDGAVSSDLTPFLNELRTALGVLAAKVVTRNVLVLQYILVELAHEEVPAALRARARALDSGTLVDEDTAALADGFFETIVALLPVPGLDYPTVRAASTDLLVGLLDLGADSYDIPTAAVRERLFRLSMEVVRVDDLGTDYASVSDVEDLVQALMDCNYLPSLDPLAEFCGLLVQALAERLAFVLAGLGPLLTEFYKALSDPVLAEFVELFEDLLEGLEDLFADASALLAQLEELLREALDALEEAQAALNSQMAALRTLLRGQDLRDDVVEAVRAAIEAAAVASLGPSAGPPAFAVTWPLVEAQLDDLFDVPRQAADSASAVLGDATSSADAADRLADHLVARASAALVGVDLGAILEWLAPTQIAQAVASVVQAPPLGPRLDSVSRGLITHRAATQRRDRATADRDAARTRRQSAAAARSAVTRNRIRPRIVSPAALADSQRPDGATTFATSGPPVLRVLLGGGDHRLLAAGDGRRLHVRLNGREIELTGAHLVMGGPAGCELVRPMTVADGLRGGLNVVECAVVSSGSPLVDRIVFAAVPTRAPEQSDVRIDLPASRLDAAGDDHLAPEKERVTIVNTGTSAVDLLGWAVVDRAGHTYRFPATTVAAGRQVHVHTGIGTDTPTRRYWGRTRAVWNNTGDTITLVGADGLVRDQVTAHPQGGTR